MILSSFFDENTKVMQLKKYIKFTLNYYVNAKFNNFF